MKMESIYLGSNCLQTTEKHVQGKIVSIAGEEYFQISNYDSMPTFFMNIVSDADLWMFIASNGALTAGRRSPDNALFPYYTDDKIYDSNEITGSKTVLLVTKNSKTYLWEPFSDKYGGIYRFTRNIYKNIVGNKLIFEETNHDLDVCFRYSWLNCDKFGFVKKSEIVNLNSDDINANVVDGIQNILPAEVERKFQLEYSTLLDGYKKNELLTKSRLGLFSLSSVPTDKAEPSESLKANTVWSSGLEDSKILLCSKQLDAFRNGSAVYQEEDVRAERGAYFLQSEFTLSANKEKEWFIVADINKTHKDIAEIDHFLITQNDFKQQLEVEIKSDTNLLTLKIAQADGLQLTSDPLNVFRHFSNTLYNIMRGGIFDNGYTLDKEDFQRFVNTANKALARKYEAVINNLPEQISFNDLQKHLPNDRQLERLCAQYLPLTFSRRHGDPSRPWNQFSIDLRDEAGNKKCDYQGNWRDIFQNWEALALSYPEYIENMITKFLSASTADGYNPYRVMRDGFDWEIIDPTDSWSHIGYWGDHQIIYLLKLLELSHKYHPDKLQTLLKKDIFTYANVPYKIKSYSEILENPHETIDFDFELNEQIEAIVEKIGNDGKFISLKNQEVYHVNLLEKLLVPVLVKMSNFVPGAGIWMNTQRPEWNDANNALVGYGASMVTLYYIRRFFEFGVEFFDADAAEEIDVSTEIFDFFYGMNNGMSKFEGLLNGKITDKERKSFLDIVGNVGSEYRLNLYKNGFSGQRKKLKVSDIINFMQLGIKYIDHTIATNKRDDNLYHAYNLLDLRDENAISIRYLYEMLEGQVAVLSSGYLSAENSLSVLDALQKSSLYREDQASYLLYPNRQLALFVEKNEIPDKLIKNSGLGNENALLNNHNIIVKDRSGNWHFNHKLRNGRLLKEALEALNNDGNKIPESDIKTVLDIYETVFDHQSFTGRSGTFYKYEGLGSIYWHMVSKLLLAVQDTYFQSVDANAKPETLQALRNHYYTIRKGIGSHKSPELYGAFSTDAYSHTPGNRGAQQPGMTGQVKEDFLSRFGEFGVVVYHGKIKFQPVLLNTNEFLNTADTFTFYNVNNKQQSLQLTPNTLAFTICQVPVIYALADVDKICITHSNKVVTEIQGNELDTDLSKSIFLREGKIEKIKVLIKNATS